MKQFKSIGLLLLLVLSGNAAMANVREPNFIDSFYSSGKITIVIAGLALVLAMLIFYLVRLDRKLTKLEKEN